MVLEFKLEPPTTKVVFSLLYYMSPLTSFWMTYYVQNKLNNKDDKSWREREYRGPALMALLVLHESNIYLIPDTTYRSDP